MSTIKNIISLTIYSGIFWFLFVFWHHLLKNMQWHYTWNIIWVALIVLFFQQFVIKPIVDGLIVGLSKKYINDKKLGNILTIIIPVLIGSYFIFVNWYSETDFTMPVIRAKIIYNILVFQFVCIFIIGARRWFILGTEDDE
ncbi:hypothetical protein KKF86_01325 [bacterium]|nr:hypothetical protein [bacterium]